VSVRLGSFSLRVRLLSATIITLGIALYGSQAWLSQLFREHAQQQFDQMLIRQLDQLTARLEFDATNAPRLDARGLSDPRLDRPFSGLYWQVDQMGSPDERQTGVLRSRSLWDSVLTLEHDGITPGQFHIHDLTGPKGESLRAIERSVSGERSATRSWRLIIAADQRELIAARATFGDLLSASLLGLGTLLVIAALAQVALGLAPLRALESALRQVRTGRSARLEGEFPLELRALIQDFNKVLQDKEEILERARTQAGNLAHALKTPLTVLGNAARESPEHPLAKVVGEQVASARQHVDWHLARARAAAIPRQARPRIELQPVVERLATVLGRLHQDRPVALAIGDIPVGAAVAADERDVQEMLGNLLDNALRSASGRVSLRVTRFKGDLVLDIEDDGPGISAEMRATVLRRGVRLDESTPGSGLGLAIVVELAQLHDGALELFSSSMGGLGARLTLPDASVPGQA
jgi:signal transduction histidine kinase